MAEVDGGRPEDAVAATAADVGDEFGGAIHYVDLDVVARIARPVPIGRHALMRL